MQMEDINKNETGVIFSLFVSGIPPSFTEDDLISFLSNYTSINTTNSRLRIPEKSQNLAPKMGPLHLNSKAVHEDLLLLREIPCPASPLGVITIKPYLQGKELKKKEEEEEKRKITVLKIFGYITNQEFKRIFNRFGKVEIGYSNPYPDNPEKRLGFVRFSDHRAAKEAVKFSGKLKINNSLVVIKKFKNKNRVKRKDKENGNDKEKMIFLDRKNNFSEKNFFSLIGKMEFFKNKVFFNRVNMRVQKPVDQKLNFNSDFKTSIELLDFNHYEKNLCFRKGKGK